MESIHHSTLFLKRSQTVYHMDLDVDGRYVAVNDLYQTIFCSDKPCLGRPMTEDLHAEDIPRFQDAFRDCKTHPDQSVSADLRRLRGDGSVFWIRWEFTAVTDQDRVVTICCLGTDASERIRAEHEREEARETLLRERSLMRTLIDNLPDGIFVKDRESRYILTNPAMVKILQARNEKQTLGKRLEDFIGGEFAARHREFDKLILTRGSSLLEKEEWFLDKKGKKKWLLTTKVPLKGEGEKSEIVGIVGISRDITERKRLQEELAQHSLAQQRKITEATIQGQEKERAEIGRELHDNISQILTTTKMYLDMALAEKEISDELIAKSHENITQVIEEIRALSRSLVPPSLGDIGLKAALAEMVKNLNVRGRLSLQLRTFGLSNLRLPEETKLMIFRIVQEQVNNIIRHAAATEAEIRLKGVNDELRLEVSDNGKGFDPRKRSKGIGLMNIVSRAQVHHGKVDIDSAPGKGCTLKVTIPIP